MASISMIILIIFSSSLAYAADDIGNLKEQEAQERADESYDEIEKKISNNQGLLKNIKVNNTASNILNNTISNILKKILSGFYKIYIFIKSAAGLLLLISEVIGVFFIVFMRNNKKIRKSGSILFCILIPLLLTLIIYGVGTLNGLILNVNKSKEISMIPEYTNLINMYHIDGGGNGISSSALNLVYTIYDKLTNFAWMLIFIFETLGVYKFIFNKYYKRSRRIGLYGYCIAIPFILLLLIFGAGPLNAIFM